MLSFRMARLKHAYHHGSEASRTTFTQLSAQLPGIYTELLGLTERRSRTLMRQVWEVLAVDILRNVQTG